MSNYRFTWGLVVILAAMFTSNANALIIRDNLAGANTSAAGGAWGQSVTTGAGTAWDNLEMNFYFGSTPIAFGNLYMLSAQYSGTPAGLAGLGTILDIGADTGSQWAFNTATTILANTTYWFYTDSALAGSLTGNTSSGVAGENHWYSAGGTTSFNGPSTGINFTLEGEVAGAVPAPATLALFGLGLAGLGWSRRKKA